MGVKGKHGGGVNFEFIGDGEVKWVQRRRETIPGKICWSQRCSGEKTGMFKRQATHRREKASHLTYSSLLGLEALSILHRLDAFYCLYNKVKNI